jgi:hypothetical protein
MAEGAPAETLRLESIVTWSDDMTPELLTSMRELHSRVNDGIHVRLLWCEGDGRVFVAVNDHRTGDAFSVEVPENERALQVFHHPYAYAT